MMDNSTVVTPEALLPVVNKYFERFSAVQWNMLSAGIQDSATTAALTDLCTEVIQILCTIVLRVVKPMLEDSSHQRESQADINIFLENLNTNVGDSLSRSFALALDVPQEKYDSAEQLTALVEEEVSQKVNSIVSAAINSPVWPSQPAVFVSGSVSNIRSLGQMVSHASKCLRRYLDRLKFQCLGECWQPKITESSSYKSSESTPEVLEIEEPEKCETPQSVKSKISVPSATKAVTDIFLKWSSKTSDMEEEGDDSPRSDISLDAQDAASDIVQVIKEDLHYDNLEYVAGCSEKSISPTPHFDMRLIFNKVREFFASQARPSDDTTDSIQIYHKQRFSRFAQEQYVKMVAELKSKFRTRRLEFLVRLKQGARSPQLTLTEDECLMPGAVPESPRPTPETPSPTSMVSEVSMRTKRSTVNSEAIKTDVDRLFHKLHQPEHPAASKTLENIKASGEIRKFSKELVDKLYEHLMAGLTDQIPVVSTDRCLSDSVIPELTRKATRSPFSPEVLYAITEDSVEKFLQKVLLWIDKEPSEKTNYSEEVSGALTDIQDVITKMLSTPEEEDIMRLESPEARDQQIPTPSYLSQTPPPEAAPSESVREDGLNVCDHADGRELTSPKLAPGESPDKRSEPPAVSSPSHEGRPPTPDGCPPSPERCPPTPEGCPPSPVLTPEELGQGLLAESTDSSSSTSDEMTNYLMTALLLRLLTKVPSKTDGSQQPVDIDAITKRLSEAAQDQVNICGSSFGKSKDKLRKINKALTKDLHTEFGSPENLLEAATASDDTSFDDALVRYLEIHLNAVLSPPKKKKSKVARFFSSVGKALIKPFTWCIKGN
ncbi:uncharacterized protein [Trachinotus anak]|uniref:uncharacterized protein n=1 Tax=Trachinotus anak TaxID=443729 RepID=UPI0039F1A1AA